jgi:hypothetical protein
MNGSGVRGVDVTSQYNYLISGNACLSGIYFLCLNPELKFFTQEYRLTSAFLTKGADLQYFL